MASKRQLCDLLSELFNASELCDFLGFEVLDTNDINQLRDHRHISLRDYCNEVVGLLNRGEYVTDSFFDLLTRVRPRKANRIEQVRVEWAASTLGDNGNSADSEPESPNKPETTTIDLESLNALELRQLARSVLENAPYVEKPDGEVTLHVITSKRRIAAVILGQLLGDRHFMSGLRHNIEMLEALEEGIRYYRKQKLGLYSAVMNYDTPLNERRMGLRTERHALRDRLAHTVIRLIATDARTKGG